MEQFILLTAVVLFVKFLNWIFKPQPTTIEPLPSSITEEEHQHYLQLLSKSPAGKEESFSFPFTVPGDIVLGSVIIRVIISEEYTDHRKYTIQSIAIKTVSHISNKITLLSDNLVRSISKQQYEDLQMLLYHQTYNTVITAFQFSN